VGPAAPGRLQQQNSVQPELNAHGPPSGCLSVQTPPVQNSIVEHWESWLHGVPGHTLPNRPASPAAHWHAPPLAAQSVWVLQMLLPMPGTVQQHDSTQPELKAHDSPCGCFRVQTPPVQNSIPEHCESSEHAVPGQMPPNSSASPAAHWQVPPLAAQSVWRSHVVLEPPGTSQQQASRQPELKAHGPPFGCRSVQTPPVQNSTAEHWESSPHALPGQTPWKSCTSKESHSQVPPPAAQSCCNVHVLPPGNPVQQHCALEWQSELKLHAHSRPPPLRVVVVVELPVTVVVDVVLAQPLGVQASQQLGTFPMHACPPFGALHRVALDFTAHLVTPFPFVMQQVTAPGFLAQVEFAAQWTRGALHASARVPFLTAAFAWPETHWTYWR